MPNSWQLSPDAGPPPINPQSYDTSQVGVVVDNVTGLMWQHPINSILGRDWDGAKAYCSGLRLAGFSDWRLPTRIELVSILDVSKHSPAINPIAFPDTSTVAFWTSSKEVRSTDPWIVSFISGSTLKYSIGYTVVTRCVRSSRVPASAPCYTFDTDTVYDVQTKLTWQRKPPSTRRVWSSAVEYCATLALNGGGWRLPTPQELQTLGDDTRPNFMSNPVAFPDPSPGVYFAASRYAGGSTGAWRVNFTNGTAQGGYPEDQTAQVRCVR